MATHSHTQRYPHTNTRHTKHTLAYSHNHLNHTQPYSHTHTRHSIYTQHTTTSYITILNFTLILKKRQIPNDRIRHSNRIPNHTHIIQGTRKTINSTRLIHMLIQDILNSTIISFSFEGIYSHTHHRKHSNHVQLS